MECLNIRRLISFSFARTKNYRQLGFWWRYCAVSFKGWVSTVMLCIVIVYITWEIYPIAKRSDQKYSFDGFQINRQTLYRCFYFIFVCRVEIRESLCDLRSFFLTIKKRLILACLAGCNEEMGGGNGVIAIEWGTRGDPERGRLLWYLIKFRYLCAPGDANFYWFLAHCIYEKSQFGAPAWHLSDNLRRVQIGRSFDFKVVCMRFCTCWQQALPYPRARACHAGYINAELINYRIILRNI